MNPKQRPEIKCLSSVSGKVLARFVMEQHNPYQPGETNGFGSMPADAYDPSYGFKAPSRRRSRDAPQPYAAPQAMRQARAGEVYMGSYEPVYTGAERRGSLGPQAPPPRAVVPPGPQLRRATSLPTPGADQQRLHPSSGPTGKPRSVPKGRSQSAPQQQFVAPHPPRPHSAGDVHPPQRSEGAHYAPRPNKPMGSSAQGSLWQQQPGPASAAPRPQRQQPQQQQQQGQQGQANPRGKVTPVRRVSTSGSTGSK